MSKEWIGFAISEFEKGTMMIDIAKEVGVSSQTVSRHLKGHGYTLGRKSTITWNIEKVHAYCEKLGIEFLESKYVNTLTRCKFKCKCGEVFHRQWNDITNKNKVYCSKCTIGFNRTKWDISSVKAYCEERGFNFIGGKYENSSARYLFKCECGKIFERGWSEMLHRQDFQCLHCSGGDVNWNLELCRKYCMDVGVKFLSDRYTDNRARYLFECSCGNKFERAWTSFYNNNIYNCINCKPSQSKGEAIIAKWLDKHNYDYVREKTFEDCKHRHVLPFDFYLDSEDTLLEFDGKQHFESIDFFGGKGRFNNQKLRDGIKNRYAKENGLKLIRIPYWEIKNIDKILETHFLN